MKAAKWVLGVTLSVLAMSGPAAVAQGNSQGHGHGKGHDKHGDDDRDDDYGYYRGHDREVQEWYEAHRENLTPGLVKKDRLPPGLEKQLVRKGTLPPGLQKRVAPCPRDLERYLPPAPPDCSHVLVGGHIVLLNKKTNIEVDFLHVELF